MLSSHLFQSRQGNQAPPYFLRHPLKVTVTFTNSNPCATASAAASTSTISSKYKLNFLCLNNELRISVFPSALSPMKLLHTRPVALFYSVFFPHVFSPKIRTEIYLRKYCIMHLAVSSSFPTTLVQSNSISESATQHSSACFTRGNSSLPLPYTHPGQSLSCSADTAPRSSSTCMAGLPRAFQSSQL